MTFGSGSGKSLPMVSTLFTDLKYIGLLAPYLERFHKKDEFLYNFRCPICGDSAKNKYKARGYLYKDDNRMYFKCWNCQASTTFNRFLQHMDGSLWRQYKTDCFIDSGAKRYKDDPDNYFTDDDKVEKAPPPPVNALKIPCITELPYDHFAVQYVANRKIPKPQWNRLYYASVFSMAVGEILPDYYNVPRHRKLLSKKEPRLVLPYYDRKKNLLGLNGRAFDPNSEKRYIVAKVSDDAAKVYGLDLVDVTKPVYVLEGPIDSLFIPNAVAMMDGSLHSLNSVFADLGSIHRIILPDNQPRNNGVCNSIKKAIEDGESVVLWPESLEAKDINDMVKDEGLSVSEIMNIIEKRTFKGLSAKLEFSRWCKT